MANGITIKLEGLNQVQKAIRDLPKNISIEIEKQFQATGFDIVRDAKALAPVDEAHLKSSISHVVKTTEKNVLLEIVVAADYAAYIEFGTGRFAMTYVSKLPKDWQTFAREFRGPGGGTFAELVERLTEWVRRKGIAAQRSYVTKKPKRLGSKQVQAAQDYNTAYIIALSILAHGVIAHPFLYPSVEYHKPLLITSLNNLTKKYK
jgi:hypothetical protein